MYYNNLLCFGNKKSQDIVMEICIVQTEPRIRINF
jgi:hypothetical protein